ncbi:toxin-activating lysine-acyltransferase [Laribacter hongkongensis]|uniref:toxin-activating lysine-acyltransferase n=1 Tax=Laribacter hongkongensis TaxID=168471 RepID=UPI001EFE491D|nr:toxin-activating lysine-acyltransferase [Laribacter hongkongensis]MCG9060186.1 toxin-activating lysine-acyltransferase [Laribacter hongkongensis]MCG9087271.1 toxin-activating lysine-acyltransferase [Laribacter hongkongensis]
MTSSRFLVAPALTGEAFNESAMLGASVWLWMHSALHRQRPLHALEELLMPAIKHGQFILASEQDKPVFFLSWAAMNQDAERRYLSRHPVFMKHDDWVSGDRIWLLDWIAPFGHSLAMRHVVKRLFARQCMRYLYHRGNEHGLKIKHLHGIALMDAEARAWFAMHPPALPA